MYCFEKFSSRSEGRRDIRFDTSPCTSELYLDRSHESTETLHCTRQRSEFTVGELSGEALFKSPFSHNFALVTRQHRFGAERVDVIIHDRGTESSMGTLP